MGDQPRQDAMRLASGAPIAAPEGLIDYCRRAPAECGGANLVLRGHVPVAMPATGAARLQNASLSDDSAIFQALMAARMGEGARVEAGSSRMALNQERWRELRSVNREINRLIRPTSDRALYSVDEFWQRPLLVTPVGARGDCEDYALEKRARLLALGWAPDMLAMAVAIAPRVGLHATLVVQTSAGDYVLDNLSDEPRALRELDYVWLSRQNGPDLANWSAAHLVGAPAIMRQIADASAEDMFQRMMRERSATPTPVEPPIREEAAADRFVAVRFTAAEAPLAPRQDLVLHTMPVATFVRASFTSAPAKPQPQREDKRGHVFASLAGGVFQRPGIGAPPP